MSKGKCEHNSTTAQRIRKQCDLVAQMLTLKNQSYGDSALHPIRVFGRGRASDLIRARIDDKLSRIRNAPDAFGEDAVMDLMGYLVMLQLALQDEALNASAPTRAAAGGCRCHRTGRCHRTANACNQTRRT